MTPKDQILCCKQCGISKPIKEFGFYIGYHKKVYYRSNCKKCASKNNKEWKENNPWLTSWYNAKTRCECKSHLQYKYYGGKGIKFYLTIPENKELWFRDKAFLMGNPTIDRINSDKDYIFDNCRFIEFLQNVHSKKCVQLDKNGNIVCIHPSISAASRNTDIDYASIGKACRGKYKQAGGFMWRFENDK